MPIIPFSLLCPEGKLKDAGLRVRESTPGMVLTTGQSASGKVTILMALADAMAANFREVLLLSDQPDEFTPFRPLPDNWREVLVQPNAAAWQETLRGLSYDDALLVLAPLNRANAPAAMAFAHRRWVFAAVDTLALGLDASYALREMGVSYDAFADGVRCVWSQFLADALCDACATDAGLTPEEVEALFPGGGPRVPIRLEVGCARCDGRGTQGRVAVSDVTFISDAARPVVRGALARGVALVPGPDDHIPAQDQAHELLERGSIGINTYRDAIQRNPLLRTQNALELVRTQSVKLTSMFDTFVRSLWVDIDVLKEVAERTTSGVIVAEADGRIRFVNARARQALEAEGGLAIVAEHLVAESPKLQRALGAALAQAVGQAPAATRLDVDGGAHRGVFVAPLPTARGFASGMRRLALVVVGSPGDPGLLPSAQDLREYFDLTPAESKVALLLCAGLVPKEVARELQVSIATVRSHLRALLEKTGTSRQAELVLLLSSLPRTG